MAAHFVFIKGADEEVGSRSHVWPDGGINFYFNESLEKFPKFAEIERGKKRAIWGKR